MAASLEKPPFANKSLLWGLSGLGIALAGLLLTFQFVEPAPPERIRIAAGSVTGAYYRYAERYREILARDGVELEILETAGAVENIARLQQPGESVDLGFLQGGLPIPEGSPLESLGSLFYEPVWILIRAGEGEERLHQLQNKRIGIGPEGSGTAFVARAMLAASGLEPANTRIFSEPLETSAKRLAAGELDLLFLVASADSPLLRRLIQTPGIHLRDLPRAEAYARTHPALIALQLPEGSLDLKRSLPAHDLRLVAATANLAARPDLHPALVDLLIEAAREVHGGGSLFAAPGVFPSPNNTELPLNREAKRHYEYGPPLLQRYLPFWAATLINRLKIMLLPLVGLLFPLFKIMPPLYRWRIRSRIYRWYARLREIDNAIARTGLHADHLARLYAGLDRIESEAKQVEVPLSYTDQLYNLRLHIKLIREKLDRLRAGVAEPETAETTPPERSQPPPTSASKTPASEAPAK